MISFSIYKRDFSYFFTSFIWTATLSVVPQVFFMSNYPEQKNTLLSLFLLFGTIASIIGILTSHGNKVYYFLNATEGRRNLLIAFCICSVAVTFSALLIVKNLIAYFVLFIILKFISNLFYNYIDRLFVAVSNPEQLKIHVRANLLFQLLGIMLAPFYFSIFAAKTVQNIVLIWAIAFLSLLFIYSELKNFSPLPSTGNLKFPEAKLSLYHKLFITYVVLILSATTMLISIMIYILRDYYQFSNTAMKGGIIIGVISIFAVISVLMSGILLNLNPASNLKFFPNKSRAHACIAGFIGEFAAQISRTCARSRIYTRSDFRQIFLCISSTPIGVNNLNVLAGSRLKYAKDNQATPIKFAVMPNIFCLFLFITTILAFYYKVSSSFYLMLGLSALSGIAYGIFLSSTRNYASSDSQNNTGLISIYNNLANYASLVSFLLIFPVSLLSKALALNFCKLMLSLIAAFFGLSLLALVLITLKSKSLKQIGGAVHD